jgi:hypothetical protein
MTKRWDNDVPDNEVPLVVQTPHGTAVVSLVSVALASRSAGNADRLILRSTIDGRPDIFAVFERHRGDPTWWKVTADLTLAELNDWPDRRRPGARPTPPFQRWLDRVVGPAGMKPPR